MKTEPNATPELKRFLMFLAVGTLTTGTCYAVFALLVWLIEYLFLRRYER